MSSPRKLDQLTFTRFIAALSVVLYHGGRKLGVLAHLPMLTSGPTAVGYFYVLSGFVMALVYHRPGARFNFREYWLARFSRIYPVYSLSFALTCFYYLDILSKVKADKIWANVFLYQAWFVEYSQSFNIAAWSLSVEIFFYLILPFIVIFAPRLSARKVIWLSLLFWALSQIIQSVLTVGYHNDMREMLNYFPLFHLNAFLIGVAGGIWFVSDSSRQPLSRPLNLILLLGSLSMVLLLLGWRDLTRSFPGSFSLDDGLLAPLFLIIILTLAMDTSRLSQILSHSWLVLLGDASYALYILHIPIRWLTEKYLAVANISVDYNLVYCLYVLAVIGISILVFKYVERPARDWLRMNPNKLLLILLDVALMYLAIRLGFYLRLGDRISAFLRTQNFTLRIGLTAFFVSLLIFRFYAAGSWRALALSCLCGSLVLAWAVYFAWGRGWVEGFPRPILFMVPALIFLSIYSSRLLINRLISKPPANASFHA